MPNKKKKMSAQQVVPYVVVIVIIVALVIGAILLIGSMFKSCGSPQQNSSAAPATTVTTPASSSAEVVPTATTVVPPIADDGTDGYMSNNIYIWNSTGFELFFGTENGAKEYAQAISNCKNKLGSNIRVYNMVVPNHSEFGLPRRIRDSLGCSSQRERTATIYSSYTADVKPVDIYDTLNLHKNEYIYLNTDTHWSSLGGYYAYEKFCQVAEVEPMAQAKMKKSTISGYLGYLHAITEDPTLAANPDYLEVYDIPADYTAMLASDGLNFQKVDSVNSPYEDAGYSIYCWGDQPLLKVINHQNQTGRKLVIVKDSYGNCMAPYLVASFDEVHVIDFRSFPQNLVSYCNENGITDVLFFNNVMSAYSQADVVEGLVG